MITTKIIFDRLLSIIERITHSNLYKVQKGPKRVSFRAAGCCLKDREKAQEPEPRRPCYPRRSF